MHSDYILLSSQHEHMIRPGQSSIAACQLIDLSFDQGHREECIFMSLGDKFYIGTTFFDVRIDCAHLPSLYVVHTEN
jgi:hypothetical protein